MDGLWGIFDLDGRAIIPPIYEEIGQWADRIPAKKAEGWVVLDQSGQEVWGPLPIDRLRGNSGHCIAGQSGDRAVLFDDRAGRTQNGTDPLFRSESAMRLYRPGAGLTGFSIGDSFGFLDCATLRVVVEAEFQAVRRAVSDNRVAAFLSDGSWGLMAVSESGAREILPPRYSGMREIAENRLPVKMASGKWGYLDGQGSSVIEAVFDQAYSFSDGIAGVQVGDKRGFVLPDGTYAAEPQFEDFWRHSDGIAPVKMNGKWGAIAFDATSPAPVTGFDPQLLTARLEQTGSPVLRMARPHRYFRQYNVNAVNVVFSGDGRLAATLINDSEGEKSSPNSEIAVWDVDRQLAVGRFSAPHLQTAVFLGDGAGIAVGRTDGAISIRESVTGTELARFRPSTRAIIAMALDGSGKHLMASDGSESWIWDLATGQIIVTLPRGFEAVGPRSAAEAFYAATLDGTILELDATSGRTVWGDKIEAAPGHARIALGGNGELALASDWASGGSGHAPLIAKTAGDRTTAPWLRDNGAFALDFADDGTRLVFAGPERIQVLDTDNLKVVAAIAAHAEIENYGYLPAFDTVALVPQTREALVVGAGGAPILKMNLEQGTVTGTFGIPPEAAHFGVAAVAAGGKIFVAPHEASVVVFDLEAMQVVDRIEGLRLPELPDFVDSVSLSTDGAGTVYFSAGGSDEIAIDAGSLAIRPGGDGGGTRSESDIAQRHGALLADLGLPDRRTKISELADGRVLFLGRFDGVHEFFDTLTGQRLARLALLGGEDWVVFTDLGFFDGTERGIETLSFVQGLTARPVAEKSAHFHRPDLVRAILAGDPEGKARDALLQLAPVSVSEGQPADQPGTPAPSLPGLSLTLDPSAIDKEPETPPQLPGLSLSREGTD